MSTIVKIALNEIKDAKLIAYIEQQKQTGRTQTAIAKDLLYSGFDAKTVIMQTIQEGITSSLGDIEAKVRLAIIEGLAPLLVPNADQKVRNPDQMVQISDQNGQNGHHPKEEINPFSDW